MCTFQKLQNSILFLGGAVTDKLAPTNVGARPSNFTKLPLYDGEKEVYLTFWRALVKGQIEHTMVVATPQAKAHMIRGNLSTAILGHMANTAVYDAAS